MLNMLNILHVLRIEFKQFIKRDSKNECKTE